MCPIILMSGLPIYRGHLVYLDTSPTYDFLTFRQVAHDCTEEFLRISKQIIAIEGLFREEFHNEEIANLIRKVQESEQKKLELVRES